MNNYRSSGEKILFISSQIQNSYFIRETLKKTNYEILEAKTSESGIQKALEYKPDLIICRNELNGYNGFQLYNILKSTLVKNGILFFIYSDNFDKEDILIGLEMGVDNFIVSPVDEQILIDKIELYLWKIKELKGIDIKRFEDFFEHTPVAKFVVVNNSIERTNQAFNRLMPLPEEESKKPLFSDVFNLSSGSGNSVNFRKCMNGCISHCCLTKLPSKLHLHQSFDVYLHYNNNNGKGRLFGELVPHRIDEMLDKSALNCQFVDNKKEFINIEHLKKRRAKIKLTPREKQVLELSCRGIPLKKIAEKLQLSQRTVEKHRANIMQKTNTTNIVEAIYAFQNNYQYTPSGF